jgi:hypothetical protein
LEVDCPTNHAKELELVYPTKHVLELVYPTKQVLELVYPTKLFELLFFPYLLLSLQSDFELERLLMSAILAASLS